MRLNLSDVAQRVGGRLIGRDAIVSAISIDSRETSPGSLFCAIRGATVDGHDFVKDAANAGAVAAMLTREIESPVPCIVVESVETALAKLAKSIRSDFDGAVIGITGSVGKTSTKELLAMALGGRAVALKSEHNLNTEYGVPMTWMQLEDYHRYAVIEMGMRGLGQIRDLCTMCSPHVGIITAIGTAHIGELGSAERIFEAKAEMFESLPPEGTAIAASSADIASLKAKAKCTLLTFGEREQDHARLESVKVDVLANRTSAKIRVLGNSVHVEIPAIGKHQALNAAAALLACWVLGLDVEACASRLRSAELPKDRLTSLTHAGATILVDVYNSSPESCREALAVLRTAPATGKRIAILGDMKELGKFSSDFHESVGKEAAKAADVVVAIGEFAREVIDGAKSVSPGIEVMSFEKASEAVGVLRSLCPGDVVLVKGSRALRLEDILKEAEIVFA